MPVLDQGAVVLAEFKDPRGHNPKVRPAIVVSSDAEIKESAFLFVVAITSQVAEPLPENHLELPWDPTGKARSGLKKRSVAVCDWVVSIAQDQVERVIGHLPPTLTLEIVRRLPR